METIGLTEEQRDWIEQSLLGGQSSFLSARAGTGKTSTIVEGLRQGAGAKAGFLNDLCLVAFNKENQLDLQARVPLGTQVATLHGLGYKALRGYNPRISLETSKVFELLKRAGIKGKNRRARFSETMRLVGVAKNWGLGVKGMLEDTSKSWIDLGNMYCLYQADLEIARETLFESTRLAKQENLIDFDDMVYLPALWHLGIYSKPGLVVDEAQDLSPLNLAVLKKTPGKKWYVGDPYQCIYQFRGAGAGGGLEDLLSRLPEYPLTTCWRCSKEVIKEARKWVGDIRVRDGAPEGSVQVESRWINWAQEPVGTILARRNEDLIQIALDLWKAGRPVYILGREMAGACGEALDEIPCDGVKLEAGIKTWIDEKCEMYPHASGWFSGIGQVLLGFLRVFKSKAGIGKNLGKFFSDKPVEGAWILSTIHKAKGKEWPEVWLLDWEQEKGGEPWTFAQERNLKYVAITRAKDTLHIVPEPWWKEISNGK